MLNFPKARKVNIGNKTSHYHHNSLAEAFNQKILSGLGDSAWRIFYYAYSTFRGLRNPQDTNFPAQDEWFKFYAHLESKMSYSNFGWPQAPAGEAEGANVANPFMAWIFGNNSKVNQSNGSPDDSNNRVHGYWSEPVRLGGLEINRPAVMPTKISGDPNLGAVWYDSEYQRGCCAFIEGYKYLPRGASSISAKELQLLSLGISAAARKHLDFVMETVSMGRYAPSFVPDQSGKGGIFRKKNAAKDQIEQALFYYLSYFRGTEDQRAGHNMKDQNVKSDGFDFETFFSRQFLLAPNYAEPKYELTNNDFNSPKKDLYGNNKIKYDSSGYPELNPASPSFYWTYPLPKSDSENIVKTAKDDDFLFRGANRIKEFDTNPNPGSSKNRFCLSAIFIQSSDIASFSVDSSSSLLSGLCIDVYVDGKLYEVVPINNNTDKYIVNHRTGAENATLVGSSNQYAIYQFNKIHYFTYPVKGKVSFRVRGSKNVPNASSSNFGDVSLGRKVPVNASGYKIDNFSLFIKMAHVLEMKPNSADAYVMMRVATTEGQGSDAGQMDPVGHFNFTSCKEVFKNYSQYGVAYNLTKNTLYQNDTYVSANPVYESTRKFINENVKMADRVSLVDYEIDSQGKSVLYFSRYAMGMKNTGVDIFRGIGPSIDQVGNRTTVGTTIEKFIPIIKGKKYIVLNNVDKSGHLKYRTGPSTYKKLSHGSIFTGGDYHYVSFYSSGNIAVYELEGITSRALIDDSAKTNIFVDGEEQAAPGNISNEWSMFMSYNLYHWSNSSAWKPSNYGDIMGALNARCLTSSSVLQPSASSSKNVKSALANVSSNLNDLPLLVEAPSGYTYVETANTDLSKSGDQTNKDLPTGFAASCPIYKAPYYVESVARANPYDPRSDVVKVTLNARITNLTYNTNLSGKLTENVAAYADFIAKEGSVRTDETAAIEYLLSLITGKECNRNVIGDVALDNDGFWTGQRPFGCCYPRFYFVKLVPYVSANSVMYSDHYKQIEYYLRAMSNGFVNRGSEMPLSDVETIINENLTSISVKGGYDSAVGDYLFEDLMRRSYDISSSSYRPIAPNSIIRQ
jgi:hypothetical protein